MTSLGLGALVVRPSSAPLWLVVAALLALATFDSLNVIRDALDTAVRVSAAAERLEELDHAARRGATPWTGEPSVRLDHVRIVEEGAVLVDDATLVVASRPTGRAGRRLRCRKVDPAARDSRTR